MLYSITFFMVILKELSSKFRITLIEVRHIRLFQKDEWDKCKNRHLSEDIKYKFLADSPNYNTTSKRKMFQ